MMTLNYSNHANPAIKYVSLPSQSSGQSLMKSFKARNINV
jgi:hypothetical protein